MAVTSWEQASAKQRRIIAGLALALVILGGWRAWGGLSSGQGNFPLGDAAFRQREEQLAALRRETIVLNARAAEVRDLRKELAGMRGSVWMVDKQNPIAEVAAEFNRLAAQGQIRLQQTGRPIINTLPQYEYIQEVEFSLQMQGTMREVARLLAFLEQSERRFIWKQASFRSLAGTPQTAGTVMLNGVVKVYLLTPQATRLLEAKKEATTR